jgi:hypothetical protein
MSAKAKKEWFKNARIDRCIDCHICTIDMAIEMTLIIEVTSRVAVSAFMLARPTVLSI